MTSMSPLGAADRFDQHLIAGGELLRQGRLPDAVRELSLALELEPQSAKALALLGLAYFRGGKFSEARPVYERLVAATPGDASHQLNLGLVHLKLGDAEAAIAALERSRDVDPSQGRAVNYLGLAYARAGRFAEAYQAFLIAGQSDLAREISENLVADEREAIESSIRRPAGDPRPAVPVPAKPVAEAVAPAGSSSRDPEPVETRSAAAQPVAAKAGVPELSAATLASAAPAAGTPPRGTPAMTTPASVTIEPRRGADARAEATAAEPPAPEPRPVKMAPVTIEPRKSTESGRADAAAAALSSSGDDDDDPDPEFEFERGPAVVHARPPTEPGLGLDSSESQRFTRVPFDDRRHAESKEISISNGGVVLDEQRGAISRAVAQAVPVSAGATGLRVAAGSRPPQPLSEFATARLVRPEDGDHPFEISAGGVLIVRVVDKMFSRTEGVDVTGGRLTYEPAMRRSRGQNREEPFETDGRPMFTVSGRGHLIAAPLGGQFTAVSLDEDIFYLREDLVFAFEPALRWENGHVPGSRHRIPMVQFRGTGAIAFRTERPLLAVKLAQDRVLYIDATALAGWIGRVVPRAVSPVDAGPTSELFVECAGEGVVLVQEEQAPVRPPPPA